MSPSPSGFASLRARFEQNQQDTNTSPPSRGRSPAGSIADDTSRPISKVRTNFVAVEPSGNMAPGFEAPTVLGSTNDGSNEPKPAVASTKPELDSRVNGNATDSNHVTLTNHAEAGPYPAHANEGKPNKPASTAESNLNGEVAELSKSENPQGLGPILKGSPFEAEVVKETGHPQESQMRPQLSKTSLKNTESSSDFPIKTPQSVLESVDKATSSSTLESQVTQKPTAAPTSSSSPSLNGKPKEARNMKPYANLKYQDPNGRVRKETSISGLNVEATLGQSSSKKTTDKSAALPRTPTAGLKSPREPPGKKDSTKSRSKLSSEEPKRTPTQLKEPVRKVTDRLSTASKAPVASKKSSTSKTTPSASTASKPAKKAAPTTRPKSPTRPVKLPAAAMASTASSAAKHDGEDAIVKRPPSRQNNAPITAKVRRASLTKPSRSIRASLPADSTPLDKPKPKPKPRSSMASTTGPSGGFLERMMRPTQSSAQKTHDKVEPKSPPRQTAHPGQVSKLMSKSRESACAKSEMKETEPTDNPNAESQAETNPTQITESTDVQPLPLTDSTIAKSD